MFLGYILKVCLEATRKLTEREIEETKYCLPFSLSFPVGRSLLCTCILKVASDVCHLLLFVLLL